MAVGTFTCSSFAAQPKQVHTGNQSRRFTYNSGAVALGTAGDVVLLCKIPHGANIVGLTAFLSSAAAGSIANFCVTKGDTISATSTILVLGSFTTSAALARFDLGTHGLVGSTAKVSISDDDTLMHGQLRLVFTGGASATVSVSLEGIVSWAMDVDG